MKTVAEILNLAHRSHSEASGVVWIIVELSQSRVLDLYCQYYCACSDFEMIQGHSFRNTGVVSICLSTDSFWIPALGLSIYSVNIYLVPTVARLPNVGHIAGNKNCGP